MSTFRASARGKLWPAFLSSLYRMPCISGLPSLLNMFESCGCISENKMATTSTNAHPIAGEILMVGTWIEAVIYGINCTMYGMSMFVLSRGGKLPTVRWVLLLMSTILFLLCTAHIGASLQQLLEVFVYAPVDLPYYPIAYWLKYDSLLPILKNTLFDTLVFTQDLILIWRLYVVFAYDWRVVVLPLILDAACIGTAYAASSLLGVTKGDFFGSIDQKLSIVAFVLNIVLNVSVTVAIATRLWWMGHEVVSLTATRVNPYVSAIHIIVESGAIFSATSLVLLVLFATSSIARYTGLDVGSQVAALTPFLIVVRVGHIDPNHPRGNALKSVIVSQDENMLRIGVHGELDLQRHFSAHPTLSPSPSHTGSTQV